MKDILKVVVYGAVFAVPFLTLYVANDYFFPYITGKNFWFRIIVEIAFAAWVLLALLDAKYRPKFSWILASFSVLVIVMFFSSLFAIHPATAFFSNFERMDGYITLIHVFVYVVVLGSVVKEMKHWRYFAYTTLAVAFLVALLGIIQFAGNGYQGRIDSQLGNAAYMAIYMLFHLFISFWMFVDTKKTSLRLLFAFLSVIFIYTLIQTGTRGTMIGFMVGTTVMVGYIALFGQKFRELRKYAIAACILIVVAGGALFATRDTAFVQGNPNLARVANISLGELSIRTVIWGMAFEGVKERPLLGWGQGNFNYVFNEQYQPQLYGQEQWFDRTHNLVLDWLIAGGVLGLLAYVSIFLACLYYLFWRPLFNGDESFTILERGVLLGLLAGYVTHNLVVFDNIISYIFFAVVLAVIHSRVGQEMPKLQLWRVDEKIVTQFAAPVVVVALVVAVFTLHVPSMRAATDIIVAYRAAPNAQAQYDAFDRALTRGSFAQQEIVEQVSQMAMNMARDEKIAPELRKKFIDRAETELLAYMKEKPGDARLHVFAGSFYRAIGSNDKAAEQMALARALSPRKQAIIAQQGVIELGRGDNVKARDFFKESYDLDNSNQEAKEYYAATMFYTGEGDKAKVLMNDDVTRARFALSDFMLSAVNTAKDYGFLSELYKIRLEKNESDPQNWASLAFLYNLVGDKQAALATLAEGANKIPSFAPTANCVSENLKADRDPQLGCQ